jgi:hypothetical protein
MHIQHIITVCTSLALAHHANASAPVAARLACEAIGRALLGESAPFAFAVERQLLAARQALALEQLEWADRLSWIDDVAEGRVMGGVA